MIEVKRRGMSQNLGRTARKPALLIDPDAPSLPAIGIEFLEDKALSPAN
jgi:hypothetical protein